MLKIASAKTVALIKEKIINMQIVKLPINCETIQIVYNWFEDEEISLANAEAEGEMVDPVYFQDICKAVDELFCGSGSFPDLEELNKRLHE